jgi:hypothetical protein
MTKKQNRVSYSTPIPVKLNPEILKRLDHLSKLLGEPRSVVMRLALRLGIAALEKAESSEELVKLVIAQVQTEPRPLQYPPSNQEQMIAEEPSSAFSPEKTVKYTRRRRPPEGRN